MISKKYKKITKSIKNGMLYLLSRTLPTKIYLQIMYWRFQGKSLRLKNPQTLNEKLQWKKLYDQNPLYTLCADKYLVRSYIKNKIGEKYLIPLLAQNNDPNKINFDKIDPPFIVKSNHSSGQTIIIKNKGEINRSKIIEECKKWLKVNYYPYSREWQYKNIPPKIIVERLLSEKGGRPPEDYKFHCFNGKVEFIQFDKDRFGDHQKAYFNPNWEIFPFMWDPTRAVPDKFNKKAKPLNLKKMIRLAEKLSKGFDYIRVDLYSIKNKIYFGELTFHHGSGFSKFTPQKWDLFWGTKLKLKNKKN